MSVDWTKPIEAVHEDGRVASLLIDGGPDVDGDYYVKDEPSDCAVVFKADGDPRYNSFKKWRIRNVQSEVAPAIDAHYTKYAIQPMEFSLANGLDPAQHTVIKYVVRYRDKGGVRDLKAAIRVLELMIERAERDNG